MPTTLCKAEHSQLLIIDVQERLASVMPDKVLEKVLRNCQTLIIAAMQLAVPVIRTEQYPKGLGPTHSDLLSTLANDHQAIEKTCFSGCGATGMEEQLADKKREQWILTGMETHICVLQTCMELLDQGKTVFVVTDGVCSRTKSNYQNAVDRMRNAGAIITNTESVLFEWLKDAGHPEFKELSRLIR
jgi:nicotinamidase-related amidase